MSSMIIQSVAQALHEAESTCQAIAPIHPEFGELATVDVAYAVQDMNTQRALNNGRRLVGKKIGLTSFAVQKQLGVDSPDFGILFGDMEYQDGESIPFSKLIQPKVEAEIALVLKADLTQAQHSRADIIAATDYAVAAIEVVDSRIENWKISLLDTIADNASSAAFVLGQNKVQLSDVDLVNCQMQMINNGQIVSQGQGKACLDNPLNAAVWLANEMVKRGRPLQAGNIVLTGALGPMVAVQAGEAYQVNIDGLGSVTAVFSV